LLEPDARQVEPFVWTSTLVIASDHISIALLLTKTINPVISIIFRSFPFFKYLIPSLAFISFLFFPFRIQVRCRGRNDGMDLS